MKPIFEDRHLILSGGLGGIGLEIVKHFLAEGARVSIGDRLTVEEAAARLAGFDINRIRYDQVDVSMASEVQQWVTEASQQFGVPHYVVPNAAVVTVRPIRELAAEDWQRELGINLLGAIYLAQSTAELMVEAQVAGSIVFLGSWAGHRVHLNMAPYSVSKAGMRMACQCMAREYAEQGIRVNEVAPGYVDAGLSGKFYRKNPEKRRVSQEKVPLGQLIHPSEVAWQVAQLCHPRNLNTTGSTILMDGGLSLL